MERQQNADKNKKKTQNISPCLPTGSTVAVWREDVRPWMHCVVEGHGYEDHNGRSYKIRVTKTECIMTRMHTPFEQKITYVTNLKRMHHK